VVKSEKMIIYYLTDDTDNPREREEIEYLKQFGPTVLVTSGDNNKQINCKKLFIKPYTSSKLKAHNIWMNVCRMLSRAPDTEENHYFAKRNVYGKSKILRFIVNSIWIVKRVHWVDRMFPRFEQVFFLPFKVWLFFSSRSLSAHSGKRSRVVVFDPVLVKLGALTPFLVWAKKNEMKTIANVKSWDNPSFPQFTGQVDGFLVWGEPMWADLQKQQRLNNRNICAWGARQFIKFFSLVEQEKHRQPPAKSGKLVIGYAAAFGDSIMARFEVKLIQTLAKRIEQDNPDAVILFRPYPAAPAEYFESLAGSHNVIMKNIEGNKIDRFGDGREFISFGSERERLNYLQSCDCFISLATTFTIEAAIAGIPIIHLFLDSKSRQNTAEKRVFERIEITDHLIKYYNGSLQTAHNYDEVNTRLHELRNSSKNTEAGKRLLQQLGLETLIHNPEKIKQDVSTLFNKVANIKH